MAESPRREADITKVFFYAALIALAALEVAPLWLSGSVPAFEQDWAWPVAHSQIGPFVHFGLSPWNSDGVGRPLVYPTPWWPFMLAGFFCYMLGVHGGLVLLLFLTIFGASAAAAAFSGQVGIGSLGRLLAGAAFAANPVVLNQVHAGHWIFLICYAMLPLIMFATLSPGSMLGNWFVLGGLVGLGAAQLQFLPMDLVAVATLTLASARTHKLRDFLLITSVACLITAPQWVLGLMIAGPGYLSVLRPLPQWELVQSAPIGDALRLLGYIGGYDNVLLSPAARFVWWWLPALAVVGILANRRTKMTWGLCLLAIVGMTIVSGIRGPASGLWAWLFAHVPAVALFRELYNGAALAAFSMVVLAAGGIDALRRKSRAAGLVVSVVALTACFLVASRTSWNIPTVALDAVESTAVSTIAHESGSGRYLALPAVYPIAESNAGSGGLSPFVLAINGHAAAGTPVPTFPTAYALALLREHHSAQARAVLTSESVSFVMRMPKWQSSFDRSLEPNLRGLVLAGIDHDLTTSARFETLSAGERVVVEPFTSSPQSEPGTYAAETRDLRAVEGGQQIDIIDRTVSPNPREAWARSALWPVLPAWALAQSPGVFTLRAKAELTVPPALIVAGASGGPPRSESCRELKQLGRNFALFACDANPIFSGRPPIVVSSASSGGRPRQTTQRTGTLGTASIVYASASLIRLRVIATPGSALVLRERFDPDWLCSVPDARHIEVDGYANAWVLPKAILGEAVTIRYARAPLFFTLLWLSLLSVGMSAGVAVVWAFARRSARS